MDLTRVYWIQKAVGTGILKFAWNKSNVIFRHCAALVIENWANINYALHNACKWKLTRLINLHKGRPWLMFARSIRRVVFRSHDKSQCAALLKTTMGKAHGALSYQYFSMFFFLAEYWKQPQFFPQALIYLVIALVVVGACGGQSSVILGTNCHVRIRAWEKEGRDNAAAWGVHSRKAFHPNFFFFFFFGKSIVACLAQPLFPRTFSKITCSCAPVTSGHYLDLEIIIVKFRWTILQQHVKFASCVTIKVRDRRHGVLQ